MQWPLWLTFEGSPRPSVSRSISFTPLLYGWSRTQIQIPFVLHSTVDAVAKPVTKRPEMYREPPGNYIQSEKNTCPRRTTSTEKGDSSIHVQKVSPALTLLTLIVFSLFAFTYCTQMSIRPVSQVIWNGHKLHRRNPVARFIKRVHNAFLHKEGCLWNVPQVSQHNPSV